MLCVMLSKWTTTFEFVWKSVDLWSLFHKVKQTAYVWLHGIYTDVYDYSPMMGLWYICTAVISSDCERLSDVTFFTQK